MTPAPVPLLGSVRIGTPSSFIPRRKLPKCVRIYKEEGIYGAEYTRLVVDVPGVADLDGSSGSMSRLVRLDRELVDIC